MDVRKVIDMLKDKAGSILAEPQKAEDLARKASAKYQRRKIPKLSDLKEDMELALALLKDVARGNYTKVPWQPLLLLVGAFIYFVNPMDLVPDFIPLKGLLDDATVLIYIFGSIRGELDQYRQWMSQKEDSES